MSDTLKAPVRPGSRAPKQAQAKGAGALPRERFFVLLALAVGVVYRLLQYVSDRSFWLDEALAAAKYLNHSPAELLQPRHFGGVGPGFYLVQWAAANTLGTSELALRLPAFAAGVASLFLFLLLARRFLSGYAVPLAVGMFAVSPYLIYYTSEAKRYSLDVFFGVLLLLLAERVHRGGASTGSVAAFVAGCVVAVFFSLPCAFVAAGTTLGLAWSFHRGGDPRAARAMLAVAGVAALVLGVPLLLFVGSVSGHGAAADFWKAGYMPFPPTSVEELRWYPATFLRTFGDPLGLIRNRGIMPVVHTLAGALAFAVGMVALRRDRRALLPLLVAPLAVALLASALAVYPFGGSRATGGRTIMYLMPVFYLGMAAGAAWVWSSLKTPLRAAGILAALLLVAPPLAEAVAAVPYGRMEARSIISYVSTQRR
ncbi:MAG TPA: glycosyltransferase family 39 protein, partial [Longimicrobium sp.]